MREITIKVYKLDELSERAQERAYNDFLRHFDYPWSSENTDSLKGFCEAFNCDYAGFEYGGYRGSYCHLKRSSVSDPNDSWPGYPGEGPADMTGNRLRTWIISNFHHVLYTPKVYRLGSWGGRSRKSRITLEESCCPFTGYCMDDVLLDPIRKFLKRPNSSDTWQDILQDCLSEWASACNADCEDRQSFKSFKEDAEANEWEFTEEGEIV